MTHGDLCIPMKLNINVIVCLYKTYVEKSQFYRDVLFKFDKDSIGIIITSLKNKDNDCYILTSKGMGWTFRVVAL